MREGIFAMLFSTLVFSTAAQTKFDKGYYIGNDESRVECLVNIQQTKRTPSEFLWKINETDEPQTAAAISVREFGIIKGNKFISALVNLDISSDDENNPSEQADPDWSEQKLFLEVLVEGEASLYHYKQPTIERFFYRVNSGPIRQLVYKLFRTPGDENAVIRTNESFRQELWRNVKSEATDLAALGKVKYGKDDLISYFTGYNKSGGIGFATYTRKHPGSIIQYLRQSIVRIIPIQRRFTNSTTRQVSGLVWKQN